MVIIQGWPSTEAPPEGPVTTHRGRRVTLILLAEHACTSDLASERVARRKRLKYGELVEGLRRHGWVVRGEVVVTTVGVRGTVPAANDVALQDLGVHEKTARRKVQTATASREAIVQQHC